MISLRKAAALFAAVVMMATPCLSQDDQADLRSKIEELENEIKLLKEKLDTQPVVAAPEEEAVAVPSEDLNSDSAEEKARKREIYGLSSWTLLDKIAGERTVLGGYADIEYRSFEDGNRTFNQQRFVLGVASRLNEDLFFSSELETEKGGPQSNQKDGEIKVEQAWLEYKLSDLLNLRGGIVLVPFGRLNVFHDSPMLDLTDRPLVDRLIIPTTWSESAMGFHGTYSPTDTSVLTYEMYVMNGFNGNISASKGLRNARGSLSNDNNSNKALVGRIGYSPALGTEFGISGYTGKYDDDDNNNLSMLGADMLITKGPFELHGEWARANIERDADAVSAGIPGAMDGYYLEAAYHFFPKRWREANPDRFGQSTFTGVLRYDSVDPDDGIVSSNDVRRWTVGINFRPIEPTVLKLEYQWIDEAAGGTDNNGFVASAAMAF